MWIDLFHFPAFPELCLGDVRALENRVRMAPNNNDKLNLNLAPKI